MMNTAAIKRFLMLLSSAKKLERERLYQLLWKAESCYCLKDFKSQYDIGHTLEQFAEPFNTIGGYYQASYLNLIGRKDEAQEKLAGVRESKTGYEDKATLRLSSIKQLEGDFDEAIKLILNALKGDALPILIESAIGISAMLGAQGQHTKALEHLESVLPLIDKLGTHPLYFDVLNSYAVEFAEVGKMDEATRIITPVVKSPYTAFYPNWLETEREIAERLKRRSVVVVDKPLVVVDKPLEEPAEQPKARILTFPTQEPEEWELEPEPELELEPEAQAGPGFSIEGFLFGEFNIRDKIEDWVHGLVDADDLAMLAIALEECEDQSEKDLIISRLVDTVFTYSPEAKEAKEKWYDRLLSKIKPGD